MGLKLLLNIKRINQLLHSAKGISTTTKMESAVENLKTNPYYEKYANRIAKLQNTSPEEFMARVKRTEIAKEEEKRKKFASVDVR